MISTFDIFKIGIGPSSSHTVGPMKASKSFVEQLIQQNLLQATARLTIELYGSLALTGIGHGTDSAILMGLLGYAPESIDPLSIQPCFQTIKQAQCLSLNSSHPILFAYQRDFLWHKNQTLARHTNGMRFSAFDAAGQLMFTQDYFSIGGGFIEPHVASSLDPALRAPYAFHTAAELWALCAQHELSIAELMMANELTWRDETTIRTELVRIADTMQDCIEHGLVTKGILPGGLNVIRRAPNLYQKLLVQGKPERAHTPNLSLWPTMYAMAVNEENAAGGRIVTAPTNGAAGIMPSVLTLYRQFYTGASDQRVIDFLLTASAIAMLYKQGASISGAEVGCQGEVGVACSMAAGALTAVLGGTLAQIENAAEMAMEHHLGLTCDPIAGLVQVPCIERNGVGAEKAIKLSKLALLEDGLNKKVSLDKVIRTMLKTGQDMMSIYKETSLGGLAANIPEC